MAFCVRSERKMDYFINDNKDVGPGQYFQSNDKNYIKKRIHPPFQISSQRDSLYKTNDNPGPGSYDLIDKSFYNNKDTSYNSTKINNKKKEKNSSKINNNCSTVLFHSKVGNNNSSYLLEVSKNTNNINNKSNFNNSENNDSDNYININNNSYFINKNNASSNSIQKIGFLSKVNRFNINSNNLSETNNSTKEIGPGSYDSNLNTINNNILKINKNNNKSKLVTQPLKIEAGSLKRIISIPSKDMNGYIYDFNKTLNLLIDQTNTNEYVGPGKYDINITNKPKSILNWSKTLNLKEIKHKKEFNKRKEALEELKKRGDIIPQIKKLKLSHTKSLTLLNTHFISGNHKKGLNDLNSKLFTSNINKKPNLFLYSRDSFVPNNNEVPGPGYYTRDLINKNVIKNKKNMTISEAGFGSNSNRFLYKNKSMQDLGPTTYFIEKNKFEPDKKPDIFSHLKNKRLFKELNKQIKDSNIPGPGSYQLSHSFLNKSFGKHEYMDNNLARFKYKYNNNPGPGTYANMNNISDLNILKKNLNLKKIVKRTIDEEEEKERKEKLENINRLKNIGVPGVGTYNLENVDSININNKKKLNPKISYNSPFMMSSRRFNYKYGKVDSPIYDIKFVKKNLDYMAFSKAERFSNKNPKNISGYSVGPGSYNLINDEQWNKRTFNKIFSS